MNLKNKNPYMFVVGCPRSGTTLLQRMLDAHPMLAVANDTHFIPRVIEHLDHDTDPVLSEDLVESVMNYKRFHRLKLSETSVRKAAAEANTYSGFVSNLFVEFAKIYNKPIAGEKTPDYVKYLKRLHYLFPWVKFVHIIRDGRNVALSALQWSNKTKGPGKLSLWDENPVAVCALWWKSMVKKGIETGRSLGNKYYYEIIYENLARDTEKELIFLSNFLDIKYSNNMVRFHEGKTTLSNPKLSAKSAWLPATPGLRNWKNDMDLNDLELFEAISGDILSELGYEREFKNISASVIKQSKLYIDWWLSNIGSI